MKNLLNTNLLLAIVSFVAGLYFIYVGKQDLGRFLITSELILVVLWKLDKIEEKVK